MTLLLAARLVPGRISYDEVGGLGTSLAWDGSRESDAASIKREASRVGDLDLADGEAQPDRADASPDSGAGTARWARSRRMKLSSLPCGLWRG